MIGRMDYRVLTVVTAALAFVVFGGSIEGAEDAPPGARLIVEGVKFPEGPAIDLDGNLYFSAVYENKIYMWDGSRLKVFYEGEGGINGLAFDREGNLYGCAGEGRAIVKIDREGVATKLLTEMDGAPLNRPNDLVFDRAGNLYFTDPTGLGGEPGKARIVRIDMACCAHVIAKGAQYPNGIGVSPKGDFLYVNDTQGGSVVHRYSLGPGGEVGEAETLIRFGRGAPDGMAIAASGNLYVALHLTSKVAVVSPEGKLLREYSFKRGSGPTNLCFGGTDMRTLYITLGRVGKVYALEVDEPGMTLYSHR